VKHAAAEDLEVANERPIGIRSDSAVPDRLLLPAGHLGAFIDSRSA
jgi:hypothetical protein